MNLINFQSREAAKQSLKDLKPQTKQEAIKIIHFLSLIKSAEKDLKEKAYNFITNRCADCANHVDEETGLEVVLVEPMKKVYNETEELNRLLEQKKKLEEKIKEAQKAAGYTEVEGTSYWKATGK